MDKQLASPAKASPDRSDWQRPPNPKAAPWLVFPHGKGREFQNFYNPCEPNYRNCIKSIPEMQGKAYYHKPSHQGWLILIGNTEDNLNLYDCSLWNPISSETIQLPNLDSQFFSTETNQYSLYDLVLSSPPLQSNVSDPDNLGCIVCLLFKLVDYLKFQNPKDVYILAFCQPGDKQWKTKVLPLTAPGDDRNILRIESLVCFRSKLYAFCNGSLEDGWVIQIEIQKLGHQVGDNEQSRHIKIIRLEHADFTWIGGGEENSCYLENWVESGGEIFKVHFNCSPRGFRKVASTHIFKLDFSSMTWVLLKSLDDHVLFLCSNMDMEDSRKCYSTSTACCSAADMGLERGCLFYTLLEDQSLYTFELEDNATTVIMPCLQLPNPWFSPTWIMMPTTENRHVDGKRKKITDFLVSRDIIRTSIGEEDMSRLIIGEGELETLKRRDFLTQFDTTVEIARFLHPVDYIHFRLACKENSAILPALDRMSASMRTETTTYLSSWLISIFEDNEDTICNMIDPMHGNEKYLMKISDQLLVGATIRFSKDGWLLLSNGKSTVFCYNPLTREMIRLPDLPDNYVLGGMSFSSIPTSRNCSVIAISNWFEISGYNEINFLVTRPGQSATYWHVYDFDYEGYTEDNFMPCINNPVFYNGAFYCLDYNGMLGVFSMKSFPSWTILSKSLKQFGGFYPSYLVGCDEKLLLVNVGQSGTSVDVYRLDELEMVWVKLNSLGKHALFISNTSSFSAVAPRSCMENKIYFPRLYGERILYYSLDTCRYHCVGTDQHSLQDFHNTKERFSCTWIEPRLS